MKILLVASTTEEISNTIEYLEAIWEKKNFWDYQKDDHVITTLITGIGSVFSAYALAKMSNIGDYDYIVNPGISVANSRIIDLGRVYLVESEGFGDLGLEEADGTFNDLHDLQWTDANQYPFLKSRLTPKKKTNPTFLPTCSSLTVNKIPGSLSNIENFQKKYHVDMLSLDGAAIMYSCNMLDLKLIQTRVASRHVEPWQKETGDLRSALDQINMRTVDIIKKLTVGLKDSNLN